MFTEVLSTWVCVHQHQSFMQSGRRDEDSESPRQLSFPSFLLFRFLSSLVSSHPIPPPFHPGHPVGLPRLTAPIMSGPGSRVCVGYVALCACLYAGTSLCVFLPAGKIQHSKWPLDLSTNRELFWGLDAVQRWASSPSPEPKATDMSRLWVILSDPRVSEHVSQDRRLSVASTRSNGFRGFNRPSSQTFGRRLQLLKTPTSELM